MSVPVSGRRRRLLLRRPSISRSISNSPAASFFRFFSPQPSESRLSIIHSTLEKQSSLRRETSAPEKQQTNNDTRSPSSTSFNAQPQHRRGKTEENVQLPVTLQEEQELHEFDTEATTIFRVKQS